ncbi:GNAT family N-acetyltransferase [Streptomyces sp. SID13031]|uniref:GNAT family N-acetyltransferase n=1 Tax=Streptomyces sp. SID13031 TaxID=2706046 RepID=UPI0013C5E5C0|nr:GNAT family N-acetyltransferase [Streptomyces sp. SID13031]NEA37121.1 GNAT family N-acetyltransferase [Streptomyces sp. SID13031]
MIRVCKAELDDAEAVREVGLKTWPVAYDGLASPEFVVDGLAEWWSPEAVERGITKGITLIAVDGGECVDGDEERGGECVDGDEERGGECADGDEKRAGEGVGDERVVGMVGLGREGDFWVMWKLYVLPEYQGKGIGKALLDGAIAALPAGTSRLLLDVLVTNEPAIGFYRKNGFGAARSTPDRELGDELIWMSRDL